MFEHNGIAVALAEKEACCGMPKLELGDLDAVAKAKETNIPVLAAMVDAGWDIVTRTAMRRAQTNTRSVCRLYSPPDPINTNGIDFPEEISS